MSLTVSVATSGSEKDEEKRMQEFHGVADGKSRRRERVGERFNSKRRETNKMATASKLGANARIQGFKQ